MPETPIHHASAQPIHPVHLRPWTAVSGEMVVCMRGVLMFWCVHPISSPESAFLLTAPGTWTLGTSSQFRSPQITDLGSSTRAQDFETTVVVNGYKNGPSLRLRIKGTGQNYFFQ